MIEIIQHQPAAVPRRQYNARAGGMRVKKVNGEVRGKEGEKGEQIDLSALTGKKWHIRLIE